MSAIQYFNKNTEGRDFIVGDIHGCFSIILQALVSVDFNESKDRLFSVGDLIDRGPESSRVADFIKNDWFFPVMGNHEKMLLELYENGEPPEAVMGFFLRQNGFEWWRDTPIKNRLEVINAVKDLPYAIEIETERGTVGLLHAEVTKDLTWNEFKTKLESGDEKTIEDATWSRERIKNEDESGVEGVDRIFSGHTPTKEVTRLGNIFYIDTGAVFGLNGKEAYGLTLSNLMACTELITSRESTPLSIRTFEKRSHKSTFSKNRE